MDVSAETLQAFLDNAWDAAVAGANTLRPQFRLFETAATNLFAGGSIGSVSKNSVSQSYRGPGLGSYTPVQIANTWRMLINLYDEEKHRTDWYYNLFLQFPTNEQGIAFNTLYPTYKDDPDTAVYAFMQGRLIPVDEYQTDLTDLRLPLTLAPNRAVTW